MRSPLIIHEVSLYLDWVRQLEAAGPQDLSQRWRPTARWYQSGIVDIYTRLSTLGGVMPGSAGLILANIAVGEAWRGQGFLTLLLEQVLTQDCGLAACYVRIENVTDARLVQMLERTGFVQEPGSNPALPTLFAPIARQSVDQAKSNRP